MHVLLVPFGSHGDVHPFLGLGQALRARGHRVTFFCIDYFEPLVRSLGFTTVVLGGGEAFDEIARHPDLWHPRRSFGLVMREAIAYARPVFEQIAERYEPGETVAVGGTLAMGVRLAHDALGIPSATVHLQPAVFHSAFETPTYPGIGSTRWWPRALKRAFFDLVYTRMVDPAIAPGLNALRSELGLPAVRDAMRTWIHSPELVLGFFPSWFAPPQPDWPPRVRLVGFPLFDEREATPMPAELEAFLDAGAPPIAFTPGSGNVQARPFFEAAAEACARLGRRGVLLTRFPEQVPPGLPAGVIHVPYAPFGHLLPRVAALVHHGGIGTSAQGMAAGVPQLVMPLAHDQLDNATRMSRLGVARVLVPRRFRGPAVAETLAALIGNPRVASRCREVARRFADDRAPMEQAAIAVESLAAGLPAPA